ncbi:MAG: hypothetical protein WKF94_02685 [Solirubrobacteraceae bacterium]
MRWALLFALVLAFVGCGEDERGASGAGEHARGFLDPDTQTVITVDLDYDGEQWDALAALYERLAPGILAGEMMDELATLDGALRSLAREGDLDFDADIRPVLDGTLVIGLRPAPPDRDQGLLDQPVQLQAVYRTDAEALARLTRALGLKPDPDLSSEGLDYLEDEIAVAGGDTVLLDLDGGVNRMPEGPPLAADRLPAEGDDLVAARLQPGALASMFRGAALEQVLATPAGAALRGADSTLRVEEDGLSAEARVDFDGLAADELPLPPASDLQLPDAPFASASADQSQTTVFLARLVRAAFPGSRFVERVEGFERAAGISFDDAVLGAFAGPSVTVFDPLADPPAFAARSTLRDPDAMRELLPDLAPALPAILESLEALGRGGLVTLLLVAPDAPMTPQAFGAPGGVRVRPLGEGDELLYEVTGFEDGDVPGAPAQIVFGVLDDAFVVGSSAEQARRAATLETVPAEPAATRLRIRPGELAPDEELAVLIDRVEIDASAEDGDIVAHGELRLAD